MKYIEFVQQLKEGLITTHDITKYSHIITNYLLQIGIKHSIDIIDKFQFKLTIETNNIDLIEVVNHLSYTIGYFPSYYWIVLNNGMKNGFKEISELSNNSKKVIIQYESKYEDGLYTNNVICPDKLYHLSSQENKISILQRGIYPKSKKRISSHPERTYLFDNVNNYEVLLKLLKFSDKEIKKYMLLEIDCFADKLFLHTDPNYRLGYFTYDNINPNNIRILKENL
jgi:uncharacterized protein (UPF0333 family)